MAETYNRLKLDVNVKPGGIITAVQKDSDSRYLDVFLFNNGVPIDLTGHEVRIYMRKPEKGGEIFNDGEITEPENGRCQFLMTTAALEKTGYLKTQISIWKDNREILSTQIFNIFVTESLLTTGSIEGSNEYGALVVLFQNLYQSIDLMTDMVQNFGKAGEVAAGIPAGTFWQMLEAVYSVNKDALENASVSEVLNVTRRTLELLKKKNNMVLKKSQTKSVVLSQTEKQIMSFSFEKPVRLLALYTGLPDGIQGGSLSLNTYLINGENSISISANITRSGSYGIFALSYTKGLYIENTTSEPVGIIQDIWITQLDFHFSQTTIDPGKRVIIYLLYQEEA